MKKYISVFVILIFFICIVFINVESRKKQIDRERMPNAAGKYYPEDPDKLIRSIDKHIDVHVEGYKGKRINAIIVPCDEYRYSAKTAGYAFSALKSSLDKNRKYKTVVILGSSADESIVKPAISRFTHWLTPLGTVAADTALAEIIEESMDVSIRHRAFISNHSFEVILPFLQRVLNYDFKITPIIINQYKTEEVRPYAEKLAKILDRAQPFLLVMTTNMSNLFKDFIAKEIDDMIIDTIENKNLTQLERLLESRQGQLSGAGAVMLGLMTLAEISQYDVRVLDYSQIYTDDNNPGKVFSYSSFVINENRNRRKKMEYSKSHQRELLKIARNTIESYIKFEKKIDVKVEEFKLKEERGVFVTLHNDGQLRGCIGNIMPTGPLYLTVRDMAIQSAFHDPRFPPVNSREINEIDIEISILTVPEKVVSHENIVLGRDGVIVKRGFRQGVYLPQVADETGWSKEEFLSSLCYSKAGLPSDAWKDKNTELYTFQAFVFNEKELGKQ
ncbi:AmmeMemoRadiSam system protein A [Elusimicrobiota bacterium]